MKKILLATALTFAVAIGQANAIPFTQSSGFDTSFGALLSRDTVTPENDIHYGNSAVSLPSDLSALSLGYSVVTPDSPFYNTLTWGIPNNSGGLTADPVNWGALGYSGLRVLGFEGDINSDEWNTISRIYHQNNPIDARTFELKSAYVTSFLTVGTTDVNPIQITFEETGNSTPCSGPTGLGVCPDVWSFGVTGFVPVRFHSDGQDYLAEFRLANFNGAVLEQIGDNYQLWTREGFTSSVDVQMKLTAVPEPATMLLFGAGLAGIAGLRRKRSK